jgi:hypothetical protein
MNTGGRFTTGAADGIVSFVAVSQDVGAPQPLSTTTCAISSPASSVHGANT